MERNVKHLELRKTDVLKTSNFSERNSEEMLTLKSKKGRKVYSGERLYWYNCLQLFFVWRIVSQISFKLFCSGDKRFLSELLQK